MLEHQLTEEVYASRLEAGSEPVGLEDRDPELPPCDSLAEAIVLGELLLHPELVPQHSNEIRPLLIFPEHRLALTALERAYAATPRRPGEAWSSWAARYVVQWTVYECEKVAPGHGWELQALISPLGPVRQHAAWRDRRWCEARLTNCDAMPSDFHHPWDWWLGRLRRIAAARKLIDDAQQIAERAWRGDIDGAHDVVSRIRDQRRTVRIEVV